MTTRVLPFNRNIVSQDTGFWCGPAAVQNILASRNITASESQLAREMGTTEDGTDHVGLLRDALASRLPDARYRVVQLPGDPPTAAQRDALWDHLTRSIDNGYPLAVNWVAPASNYPRGIKGSPNPRYGGGTIWHYVGYVGWSDDDGERGVYVVDSGFWPNGYWISFDQACTLIPPKGYAYADLPPVGAAPPPVTPPLPPKVDVPVPGRTISDPFTGALWSPNCETRRAGVVPRWIVLHTQEGGRRAVDLAAFLANPASQVSYHSVNDDVDVLKCVPEDKAPWSASNANHYAFHHCFAGSYASWSRDKWLDPDAGDGKNENIQLTKGAAVVAWWVDKYGIPAKWIGGGARPPWGLDGIMGHVDVGQWGGGHSDPGTNFPVNEFMRRVTALLTGEEQPPLVPLPPVVLPGTDPDKYGDWMIYRRPSGNNPERVERVQHKLKASFSYAKHLPIDRDYSWSDEMVVRQFQTNSRLVSDGIVGPMTAAALNP